jgi:ribosome maturation protein Sdo1
MTSRKWTAFVLAAVLVVAGCDGKSLSVLVQTVGTSVVQLAGLIAQVSDPNLSAADKQKMAEAQTRAAAAIQTATTLIAAWQKGSPTDQIINALDEVQVNLSEILTVVNVTNSQSVAVIKTAVPLAIGTLQLIVSLLPPPSNPPKPGAEMHVQSMTTPTTPRTAKDYKAQWNALMDQHGAASAKIQ